MISKSINVYTEVRDAILELPKFIRSIEKNLDLSIDYFKSDNIKDAQLYLEKSMNCISSFIRLTSILSRETKSINVGYDNISIKNLQIHLLSLTKGIKQALIAEDDLMLNDLMEYELKDNLSQWNISIVPQLRAIYK